MEDYLAALVERDRREQAHRTLIDQYARIADRLAAQQVAKSTSAQIPPEHASKSTSGITDTQSLREALVAAQQARKALEAQISSIPGLQQENASQAQIIQNLDKEIAALQRRVNDRNAEIKEGKKLVGQVQDEMVSLSLQLNMAEQKSEKLQAENKELVARWMKLKGDEAEEMNQLSKW